METLKIKKAVIYCRVSTKEQVEEGNSLVTQEKNCRDFAVKNGYEVSNVFIEQGESAKTVDRTELKKLLSFCSNKKHEITAIIIYKIDRLSRNIDDYSQIRIVLKRYGIEIKSTSEYFEDTPAGRFMENIIANVAQFDNDVRAERSTGGMKDAVRGGRYIWMAPYGYSNLKISGKSTIAPNQYAPFVKRAFEEIALNTCAAEEVRKKLIKDGMINALGKPLAKSIFYRILRNKVYTGWITMFGEVNKGAFESLITEELFNRVQWVLSTKRGKNKHYLKENPDFPLRRFFFEPNGEMLTGCWSKGATKKYPYYLYHKSRINIRKEKLEATFKDYLNSFQMDIGDFDKLRKLVESHLGSRLMNNINEGESLQKRIPEIKAKQIQILEKNIDGIISHELCKEKIAELDNEIYQIKQTLSTIPTGNINHDSLLDTIRDILLNPGEVWEKINSEAKIRLQWFYFPDGIIFDGLESRTTKICKLFKVKESFSPLNSHLVNHPNSKSNIQNLQIPLRYENKADIQSTEFWKDLGEEIVFLSEITKQIRGPCIIDDT